MYNYIMKYLKSFVISTNLAINVIILLVVYNTACLCTAKHAVITVSNQKLSKITDFIESVNNFQTRYPSLKRYY